MACSPPSSSKPGTTTTTSTTINTATVAPRPTPLLSLWLLTGCSVVPVGMQEGDGRAYRRHVQGVQGEHHPWVEHPHHAAATWPRGNADYGDGGGVGYDVQILETMPVYKAFKESGSTDPDDVGATRTTTTHSSSRSRAEG